VAHPHDQDDELLVHDFVDDPVIANAQPVAVFVPGELLDVGVRAALLALPGPLRRGEGDFARFTRYADAMLEDKEFFVRKAIGWVLRETARKRPGLVCTWLLPRAARASGVTIREAIKPLSEQQRAAVLAAR
jgi:hypothetical protein